MNRFFYSIYRVIDFLIRFLPLRAQDLIKNSSVTGICYASNKVNKFYIPPPAAFFRKAGSKNGASITIYYTGFSAQGKAAMEYAASILKKLLPADARFTVKATPGKKFQPPEYLLNRPSQDMPLAEELMHRTLCRFIPLH